MMLFLQLNLNLTQNTVNILLYIYIFCFGTKQLFLECQNMPVFYHPEEQFGNRATKETLQKKDVKRQFNKGLMCEY